jgi:serine/threonine protein kinase/tetratricopeptide (TPR) repeat protein
MHANARKAKEIFVAALKLAPQQWDGYLAQTCGADDELRRRVSDLLHANAAAGSFLESPARGLAATVDLPLWEGPGTLIGTYKLLEQIGEGGFGLVFMAEQQQPVRRKVALKILKPGMDSRQVIARFEAERQALALMDHPHIAQVFDGGETGSGRPYFVMELVKGVSITDYADQNRLTTRQRLQLFAHVCQAVQHAHHKGIIHRDIKPSNVLVTRHDEAAVVKVIDFGIAKALGQQLTDKTLFTGFAHLVGTPLYMSPEQAQLSGLDIDTRSDIYSLGVLLYELLTGTTPFDKERLRAAGYDEMRRVIREEEPPRPSNRLSTLGQVAATVSERRQSDPQRLSQLLRGELDWIVMKALDKDRTRRYETASAFAADVQRYLHDEPVAACPPSAWYRCRKFVRRHKVALRTAGAAVLVLLCLAAGSAWTLRDQATRQAELSQRAAETERTVHAALVTVENLRAQAGKMPRRTSEEADAILVVWQQAQAALAPALAALKTGTANDQLRQQVVDAQKESERQRVQAQRKAKLLRDLDEARLSRSLWMDNHFDYAGAAAQYAAAFTAYDLEVKPGPTEDLARRIRAEEASLREALIVALDDWSDNAVQAKRPLLAKQLRALAGAVDDDAWRQKYRAALTGEDAGTLRALSLEARQLSVPASSLVLLAWSLDRHGEHAEMLTLLRWARLRYPGDFWVHFVLGRVLAASQSGSELDEAIGCYTTALALRPRASAAYINLGCALLLKNQADAREAAMYAFQQALIIDPQSAQAHTNLGNALRAKNQLDEAIAEHRRAIELNPKQWQAHNNLGRALAAKKQLPEAIAAFSTAIELNPESAGVHYNLGLALAANNQLQEASAACKKAMALNPKYAAPPYNLGPALAVAHNNLGVALVAKKQWDEAIAACRMATELDPKYAKAHFNLGLALKAKNQWDEAGAEYKKAIELQPDFAEAHCNLALVLRLQGQFSASLDYYQRGHALGSKRKDWREPSEQWVANAEWLVRLEAKLPDVLAGKATPKDHRERLGLVEVCRLQRRYVAAVQLHADAITADPKLADEQKAWYRYHAACYAALAAAGQGTDTSKFDDQAPGRLRQQALAWLRANLEQWSKRLEKGKPEDHQVVRATLEHWQRDPNLAGVRDADALKKLPAEEQQAWRQLWAEVAEVLKKAGNAKTPTQRRWQ